MPYTIEAICPKCGKKVKGITNIEVKFGWRIMKGERIPQAYCKGCRTKK